MRDVRLARVGRRSNMKTVLHDQPHRDSNPAHLPERGSHGIGASAHRTELQTRVLDWFDKHLK